MTREEIPAMAMEAGGLPTGRNIMEMHTSDLERFADLVAAHEREECAKVCDHEHGTAGDAADKIRARSKTC